jgi:hypothetical protein
MVSFVEALIKWMRVSKLVFPEQVFSTRESRHSGSLKTKNKSREGDHQGAPVEKLYSSLVARPFVLSEMVAVQVPDTEEFSVIGIAFAARLPGRSDRLIDTGLLLVSGVRPQGTGALARTAIWRVPV